MSTASAPARTNLLWQKDKDHFLHPWTHFDSFKREGSIIIREGQDAYVTDDAGRRYLDGIGGLWCVNIGYGRESMAQAIADQRRGDTFARRCWDRFMGVSGANDPALQAISPIEHVGAVNGPDTAHPW